MILLGFDCETSGLQRDHLPAGDPSQPHILQLAARLLTVRKGEVRLDGRMSIIIKPDGWAIEREAIDVHGIDEMRAHRVGVPIVTALLLFSDMVRAADRIVGHGVEFDRAMVTTELERAGGKGEWWFKRSKDFYCTMESGAKVVGLPGQFGEPKWPSLDEAIAHLFPGEVRPARHDADVDLDWTMRVYFALNPVAPA